MNEWINEWGIYYMQDTMSGLEDTREIRTDIILPFIHMQKKYVSKTTLKIVIILQKQNTGSNQLTFSSRDPALV